MPFSSLLVYTPAMSGSPHGVRDAFQFFGTAGLPAAASLFLRLSATSRISFRCASISGFWFGAAWDCPTRETEAADATAIEPSTKKIIFRI
jgi:hypothetical protein